MVRATSFLAVAVLAASVIAAPADTNENDKRLLVGPKKAPKGYKNTGKSCDDAILCMLYGLKDPVCVGGTSGAFTSGKCWVPKSGSTKTTSAKFSFPTKFF